MNYVSATNPKVVELGSAGQVVDGARHCSECGMLLAFGRDFFPLGESVPLARSSPPAGKRRAKAEKNMPTDDDD